MFIARPVGLPDFALRDGAFLAFFVAMRSVSLNTVVGYCDRLLRISEMQDYDGAVNGLQVQNNGAVTRIAAAVDASRSTARMAVEAGADLLVVHHGLFWAPSHPWTGRRYELLRQLLDNNLAVYSAHLPLDAHPSLGNNAVLCSKIGLRNLRPFFFDHGQYIGFQSRTKIGRKALVQRLERAVGAKPLLIPGGPEACQRIGVVSGGAGADLEKAAEAGVDTYITGEGPHWTYALAEDLGVNVLYAGHYATETFGVRALAQHLSAKWRIPWLFLDHPTGL